MPDLRFYPRPLGPFSLAQLAEIGRSGLERGDGHDMVRNVGALDNADEHSVTFFGAPKPLYVEQLEASRAKAIFIHPKHKDKAPKHMALLLSENPSFSFTLAVRAFYPDQRLAEFNAFGKQKLNKHSTARVGKGSIVEKGAIIARNVKIGKNVIIGPNTVIYPHVEIGDNTVIGANVTLSYCQIGKNVVISHGCQIGGTGFGFLFDAQQSSYLGIPHLGLVMIEDDVHLGESVTIARGSGSDTIIGRGTRIDNLVQVAHNVKIGQFCAIASQAGIAGSARIGNFVQIGGQAGITGHIVIGDGVKISAQSGVAHSIPDQAVMAGTPAIPQKEWHKLLKAQGYLIRKSGQPSANEAKNEAADEGSNG